MQWNRDRPFLDLNSSKVRIGNIENSNSESEDASKDSTHWQRWIQNNIVERKKNNAWLEKIRE